MTSDNVNSQYEREKKAKEGRYTVVDRSDSPLEGLVRDKD
jgi:hypothetical protein